LKRVWGGLAGEKYKRFPKAFDQDHPAAKYLWHKQYYIHQSFTRTQVKSPKFVVQVVKDLGAAMPFLQWLRKSVGVYRGTSTLEKT
jgi:uncharacterized protein (DUF2461 family)